MSNFNQIVFATESRTSGKQVYTAFTPWKDEITGRQLELKFQIEGRFSRWHVTNGWIGVDALVDTVLEARLLCQNQVELLFPDCLKNVEIWRNSGGFICIGGFMGEWYFYTAKNPYESEWNASALKGSEVFTNNDREAHSAMWGLASQITELERRRAEPAPVPQLTQQVPAQEPTPEPVNPLAWLSEETPAPDLETYHGLIASLKDVPLNDDLGFAALTLAINTERDRLIDRLDETIRYALTDKGRAILA